MFRSRPRSRRPVWAAAVVWLVCLAPLSVARLSAQEVTLPLAHYDELRARAEPAPEPSPVPPAPLAFEEAALSIVVDGSSARVTQELTLAVYGDGWREATLGEAGSFIAADFDGTEGRLAGRSIELRGVGRHRASVASVVPVTFDETATRPTWTLRWRTPRAALVHGTLEAPVAIAVEADGAIVEPSGQSGRWTFAAVPGFQVTFTLYGEAVTPERASLPLVLEATSAVALEVARSRRRAEGWLEVRVRQGALERLAVPVPAPFEVISVAGDAIAGWDVEDGRLLVTPLAAVTGVLRLQIEMAAPAAEEIVAPVLVPEGAADALVATKVRLAGDGLLELVDPGAGRRPDGRQAGELPRAFSALPGMALALPAGGAPPRFAVTWSDGVESLVAQVDRLLVDVLVGDAGQAAYQLWAEVRNRGVQQLTFELPPGARLVAASRDGQPLSPGRSPAGWAVPLAAGDARQVVHLSALLPLSLPEDGELAVPLPRLSAPAGRVEARISLPGSRTYAFVDDSRRGAVAPPPPVPAAAESKGVWRQLGWGAPGGGAAGAPAVASGELLRPPPGFQVVQAAWSALVTELEPLRLRVESDHVKRGWF